QARPASLARLERGKGRGSADRNRAEPKASYQAPLSPPRHRQLARRKRWGKTKLLKRPRRPSSSSSVAIEFCNTIPPNPTSAPGFHGTRPSVMGPMRSSPPCDRPAAEPTLLSVVDAEAATLCC